MTREDAIYEIKQLAVLSNEKNIDRITEALEMAIEALADRKTENSSEKPNNCEAQTCDNCKLKGTTKWCDNQVVCRAYKPMDEPQTDCPWR